MPGLLCPECAMAMPTKAHVGSRACKVAADRARLVARKLMPLPVTVASIVAKSGAKWVTAETRLPRGSSEVWTTAEGVAFVAACEKIATFLNKSPVSVAVAVQKHGTVKELMAVSKTLVWRKGTTPLSKLTEVAKIFGGSLALNGTRVFAPTPIKG